MEESQPESCTSADDLSGVDPLLLTQLSCLGGRCKALEIRCEELEGRCKELETKQAVHVRSFNRQDGSLRSHQTTLDSLAVKVERLFAGCRKMQEGVTFVNSKAHLVLKWAVLQIHKRRGERQDVTIEERLDPLEENPDGPVLPDSLLFETMQPDLGAACAAAGAETSEMSLQTPSHKKRPRGEPAKLWTPKSAAEASGHFGEGDSDTD